jgi:serine/threonine protein kinase
MATVWEGYDAVLARAVAIKVLHPHLAADQLFLERFRREAIAAARLSHPNVVATFDAGSASDGAAFIVMELVRGCTLRQYLADRGALSPALAVGIALQITDALAHAHAAGLIHRDVKPANVLVCDPDTGVVPRIKVTDFGIAKAAEGLGLDLTRTGMVLGTPKYLSPEQIEGREPDARADLYAVGVILFEMLTGSAPFSGPTDMATAVQHLNAAPPRLAAVRPELPASLDSLVAALLAKRPEDRPSSAASVRQALASAATSSDITGGMLPTFPVALAGGVAASPTAMVPAGDGSRGWGAAPTDVFPPAGAAPTVAAPGGTRSDRTPMPAVPIRPARRRRPNWPGRFVAALVVVALIVVVVVIVGRSPGSGRHQSSTAANPTTPTATVAIKDVSVFHLERDADGATRVRYTFDGNPATMW